LGVAIDVPEGIVKKSLLAFLFLSGLLTSASSATSPKGGAITQEELVRNTQELFDAVAIGDQAPWKKYFAEDAMYFDEKGRNMNKAALVKDIAPLPKGYSGTIKIAKVQSHIEGNIAILSYDMDETETNYGQNLTARYQATDRRLEICRICRRIRTCSGNDHDGYL
jgi:hypothetical protein